nr:uncharacterized protein LOC112490569 isoform X1 [Ziziphus jujuba var. spinosa]XP_048324354.1 uncharacterized protein LOC112490569 isoform X1 [Ziziphus jujuba var. spinosa]XP_048324355.1 uncharacterized protein LOC112490569 isoform X1 [Ziziphus jujuba var. spinosa]XP_048324356.1 uncharacterized protein LOC112490569 isoform X1 [Ziziphus jujuba var. spinosa]XP_048324357.1 uncharacterized protein LOC112490569 isoform X1 [Ziziphus jujuba var. spinosa]XP_048324358.1 uncharacterized protein LOC112
MRIRNSRPAPFMAPPPEVMPRSTHLRSRLRSQFDERFLVEEENRRIGWSCCPVRKSICPVALEDQLHGESEQTTGEKRSLNCVDEEKDIKHCVQINSNLDLQQQSEGEDNKGKEFSSSADSQGDRYSSTLLVNDGITFPATFSELGEKLPFKKRQLNKQLENKTGMERQEAECAMVEVEVVEATEIKEDGRINLELAYAKLGVTEEDALFKERVEDATVEVREEDVKDGGKGEEEMEEFKVERMEKEVQEGKEKPEVNDKAITINVKTETASIHGLEYLNEGEGCHKTHSINCIINCKSSVRCVLLDNKQGHCKEELGLEGKDFEPNGKERRGTKRKGTDKSADSNNSLHNREMQKLKRGRPMRVQHYAVDRNNRWCTGKPNPVKGWPKLVADEPLSGNIENPEKPKPKRGRPRKVKDQDQNQANNVKNLSSSVAMFY